MVKKILLSIFLFLIVTVGGYFLLSSYIASSRPKIAIITPTITPDPTRTPLSAEKLTALVNEWRVSQGFQPYVENEDLCKIAEDRSDDGLDNHKGAYAKYSSYPSVLQENISGGATESLALDAWVHSPAHLATLKKAYKNSCIKCDNFVCVQIFSNLENGTR